MKNLRRVRVVLGALAVAASPIAACVSNTGGQGEPADGGPDVAFSEDSGTVVTPDSGADTSPPVVPDASRDAALDTGAPGSADSGVDAPHDAGPFDASLDAPPDAPVEAAPDAPFEAAADSAIDAPPHAPDDAAPPDVYVDPVNGLDTNPAPAALPFKTIYKATVALSAPDAGAGQTVYLADGTYDSSNQTQFWGTFTRPTFVRGSAPGKAVLSGSYASEVLYFAAGGGITNVTFKNTTTSFQVQHGTFTASGVGFDGLPGFNAEGMSFLNDAVATIDTLTIANMTAMGGQDIGAILYADNSANVTWHASGTAITAPSSSPGQAIFARGGAVMSIDGLTLENFPSFAFVLYDQAQLTLSNSTITGTGPASGICSDTGCRASIWLGGSQTGVPTGALTLVGTTISGSPGSAVGYSTTSNTGAVNLTFTNSHLDANAYAGLWIGGATNAALAMTVTATGTTFDGNAMSGITAQPRASISVSGGSISSNGAGAAALSQTPGGIVMLDTASANALSMRSVTMATNIGNFLSVVGSASATLDLGTASSLGENSFSGVTAGAGLSALSLKALISGTAIGNTWMPNMQGADSSGHYTTPTTITGPANGLNVGVPSGASVVVE